MIPENSFFHFILNAFITFTCRVALVRAYSTILNESDRLHSEETELWIFMQI